MATATAEIRQLKREVTTLKQTMNAIRQGLVARGIRIAANGGIKRGAGKKLTPSQILRNAGLIGEPLPADIARAEEWRRLPEEERQRVREEMSALKLDPPLSQIIIDNRR